MSKKVWYSTSMLSELSIENFVLIKRASLDFSGNFTVITGETGAGKTLAVHALKLVLGARAHAKLVRPGAKQAVIQALFSPSGHTDHLLEKRGIEPGDEIIIRRIIPASGKGRIYINGSLVSLQDLRTVTQDLVSISGQHEYQTLLKKGSHGLWLDRFASLQDDVSRISEKFARLSHKRRELDKFIQTQVDQADREENLKREAELIDSTEPVPGEDETIEQELVVLRSVRELRLRGDNIYSMLYAGKKAVLEMLAESSGELERMTVTDPKLENMLEDLQSVRYQAEEVAWQIRDYIQALPSDMSRMDQLEERLYALKQLKRRFGPGLDDVIRYREKIEDELARASDIEDTLSRLQDEIQEQEATLLDMAESVSRKRRRAAEELALLVKKELEDLKLQGTDFVIDIKRPAIPSVHDLGPSGFDRTSFLFSANPGQEPAPLSRIASGGELSRVMLALKAVLAGKSGVETVLFDELDSGISGEVADRVGLKLKELSEHGQVIAITHYPQIAAHAGLHINVGKSVIRQVTLTEMKELEEDERIEEIARMLGGGREDARTWATRLLAPVLRGT